MNEIPENTQQASDSLNPEREDKSQKENLKRHYSIWEHHILLILIISGLMWAGIIALVINTYTKINKRIDALEDQIGIEQNYDGFEGLGVPKPNSDDVVS